MRPTRLAVIVGSALLLLQSAQCSHHDDGAKDGTQLRVALLSPGPISDNGWNAAAYDGLQRIAKELGASVRQVQVGSPSEFEGAFRDFAGQGFDLVFGHGFEFSEPAMRVAKDFPKTTFVVTSGEVVAANVSSVKFEIDQPAELAGILAGAFSKSGRVGCVGGVEIPPVKSAFEAFARGIHASNPAATTVPAFVGSWDDVAAAKQAALALIDHGADVLFHDADAAGLGVLNAAEERHVLAIGCNGDQANVKPDVVVASVVLDVAESFVRIAKDVKAGDRAGRNYDFDLKSGVVRLAENPRFASRITPEVRAKLDAARRRLGGG